MRKRKRPVCVRHKKIDFQKDAEEYNLGMRFLFSPWRDEVAEIWS